MRQSKEESQSGPTEKFYRVRFNAKSNANDTENVELSVNGEQRVIAREMEVILPERFLEVARHATYPIFKQVPGKTRKTIGNVQTFPFTVLGEATEEEYRKMLKDGTEATKEHIRKYGMEQEQE